MQKIQLNRERDFGEIFSVSFLFLKRNMKPFFSCLLLIPGPIILICALFSSYIGVGSGNLLRGFSTQSGILYESPGLVIAYFIIIIFEGFVLNATIYQYFIIYRTKGEGETMSVSEVARTIPGAVWRLFYNFLIFLLIAIGIGLLGGLILAGIAMIPILGALAIAVGLIIYIFPFLYVLYAANYLILRDRTQITTCIAKAWRYMKGNFWWTWLLLLCVFVMIMVFNVAVSLPSSIYNQIVKNTTDYSSGEYESSTIVKVTIESIVFFVSQLASSLVYVFCVFNYHSHEEKNEGNGILDRINEIQ